jgi:DegV family protein with EDD domain
LVKIVTDSTSDLTSELAEKLGITVIPLFVHFGSEAYRDKVDLSTEDFYLKLAEAKALPTTSSPSPFSFTEVYSKLAKETDEILTITISSRLSATHQVAIQGREQFKGNCRVEIIDSLTAVGGLGLIVIAAAKAAQAGYGLDQVIDVTKSSMSRVDFRIAFDTLEYLKRGGRIGKAEAFLGTMLKVNPILTIKDGVVEGVARIRSRARAIDFLYDFATSIDHVEEIAVEDANTPADVESLIKRLNVKFARDQIHRLKISPVIGTNVGPRVIGLSVLPKYVQ